MKTRLRTSHILTTVAMIVAAAAAIEAPVEGVPVGEPDTFVADTLSDNPADGYTLREALADANATPVADTVTFAPELSGTLTLTGGQLDVTEDVTIVGRDDLAISISGDDSTRIIRSFLPGVDLTVRDLVLTSGNAAFLGGAILFAQGDDVVIDNVTIVDNVTAASGGGGVSVTDAKGTITITDSRFESNTATSGNGGGLYITSHDGGEIRVERTAFIENVVAGGRGGGFDIDGGAELVELQALEIIDNSATTGDAGGGRVRSGFARLEDSLVRGNVAFDENGGVHVTTTVGNADIRRTVIERNEANEAGGGTLDGDAFAVLNDVEISNNEAEGVGGFRVTANSRVVVDRVRAEGNSAGTILGGLLVFETPELDMRRSTIASNTAPDAGGLGILDVLEADIVRATISGNEATGGNGGGIWVTGATPDQLDIRLATISGNEASLDGGGIWSESVDIDLLGTTVTDNHAGGVGGGVDTTGAAELEIVSSILWGNSAPTMPEMTGPFGANWSIFGSTAGVALLPGAGNLGDVDPMLGPLADNGGPTLTHLPHAAGPAIDAGDPLAPNPPGGDQRGFPRPVGDPDIGSVELSGASAIWTPVAPARIVDTRANGETIDDLNQAEGAISGGSERRIEVAGRAGVPSDAQGVVANITAVGPQDDGFLTVHPCVNPRPFTASLNYTTGVNLGNEVIVGLDAGDLCIFSSGATHLTVDVVGYVPADSIFLPTDPARFLDTRVGGTTVDGLFAGDGAPGDGGMIELQIENRGSVPLGARTVVLYVAAIKGDRTGFLTVWNCAGDRPLTSSLNYAVGTTRGNEIVADLDQGKVCLFTSDRADVTVDVVGWVPALGITNLEALAAPSRLLDTRPGAETIDGQFAGDGMLDAGETLTLQVGGRAEIPSVVETATINVTAVNPTDVGFVTVYPCGGALPLAASLNYVPGVNGGNEIIASPNGAGQICLFTSAATHLTVDAFATTAP